MAICFSTNPPNLKIIRLSFIAHFVSELSVTYWLDRLSTVRLVKGYLCKFNAKCKLYDCPFTSCDLSHQPSSCVTDKCILWCYQFMVLPGILEWDYKIQPIMWQSFRAIGRGTSENAWRKKTEAAKQKPVRN